MNGHVGLEQCIDLSAASVERFLGGRCLKHNRQRETRTRAEKRPQNGSWKLILIGFGAENDTGGKKKRQQGVCLKKGVRYGIP